MGARSTRRLLALFAFAVLVLPGTTGFVSLRGALELLVPAEVDARLAAELADGVPEVHRVVVELDEVADGLLLDAVADLGLDVTGLVELPMLVVSGPELALEPLRLLPGVEKLWLDHSLELVLAESRVQVGAETAHTELGVTGAGVGIAVIDSGIDGTHPDLAFGEKVVENVKVLGYQGPDYSGPLTGLALPVEGVANTDLLTGHGTHVAGIAAGDGTASGGRLRGVAPGAHLVGVGAGDAYLVTTLAAYDWVLANHEQHGIRVINNSWADGTGAFDPDHPLNRASLAAVEAGIVVVQAAGNDGQASGDVYNRFAPDWVIGVGGVDKLGRLGDYSSRGTEQRHADLVAPGSYIASAFSLGTSVTGSLPFDATDPAAPGVLPPQELPFYTYKVGTSMAAPHVAGVAALVLEANPGLTPAEVEEVLVATARPVPGCAVVDCGAGLVDAVAAIALAQELAEPPLQAPVAAVTASPASGAAPLTTTLDGTASTDADGTVVAWEWDLDADGTADETTSTPTLVTTFATGRHDVALTVVDDDGLRSLPALVTVAASDPPVAAAEVPLRAKSGDAVTLDASGSADPDGSIVSYRFELGDGTVVTQADPVLVHSWTVARPDRFAWSVTVTDDAGLTDVVAGTIRVTPGG